MDEPRQLPEAIDNRKFTVVKKGGFDQREVQVYLEDLEQAFRDLELWAGRTKDRLTAAEFEAERARHAEDAAVENAMSAVFDAKDRILQRAHDEAVRIEERARAGEGSDGPFPIAGSDQVELLREQAEQMLIDAERRAEAIIEAAARRLTEARQASADAEQTMADAREAAAVVDGEESTWAGAAQQEVMSDLRRKLEEAELRIDELEEAKTPDQLAVDRANEEAEAIIAAAQHRSGELLQQAQAAVTMPGGEAIANAEERAASIIAEAEARARQIEEAVQGIKTQAESEAERIRVEADRIHGEAQQAKTDGSVPVGELEQAKASYRSAKAEVDDLRAQLANARGEIEEARSKIPGFEAPDYPPAPPITADDAAEGIVTREPVVRGGFESDPRPALEVVPPARRESEPPDRPSDRDRVSARDVEEPPAARGKRPVDDDFDLGGELSASERLRIAAQRMRRESGIDDDGAPMAGAGSRYERRSAGLPRIGAAADFRGLRSRLAGDSSSDDSDESTDDDED